MTNTSIHYRHRARAPGATHAELAPDGLAPSGEALREEHLHDEPFADADTSREAPRAYEVGYKRPPVHTRFQKGRSGNPRGRPKGARNLDTIIAEITDERTSIQIDGIRSTKSKLQIIVLQVMRKAMSGDLKAAQYILSLRSRGEAAERAREDAVLVDADAAIDESEIAMLVYHQVEALRAQGLDEEQIAKALVAFGLGRAEEEA